MALDAIWAAFVYKTTASGIKRACFYQFPGMSAKSVGVSVFLKSGFGLESIGRYGESGRL